MNWLIIWLVLLILFIAIEVATLGLTTIWFAGGSLSAAITAAIGLPVYVQIATFLVISIVLLIFTRPIAVKYFNKDRVKTNAESIVGNQAVVTSLIDNLSATGQVRVNGMEWTARTTDENVKISEGNVVTVVAISGVKLIVEQRKEVN